MVSIRQVSPFSTRSIVSGEIPAFLASSALLRRSLSRCLRRAFISFPIATHSGVRNGTPGQPGLLCMPKQFHKIKGLSTFFLIKYKLCIIIHYFRIRTHILFSFVFNIGWFWGILRTAKIIFPVPDFLPVPDLKSYALAGTGTADFVQPGAQICTGMGELEGIIGES